MADFAAIARGALAVARQFAPLIPGGQAGVAAADALASLIDTVRPGADPATQQDLDQLRRQINDRLDNTIDSLGDRPAR